MIFNSIQSNIVFLSILSHQEEELIVFTYKKVFINFSRFEFFTEAEKLVEDVTSYFGYSDKIELEIRKKEFVYGSKEINFDWNFDGGLIRLTKDHESKRPVLHCFISTKNEVLKPKHN